MNCPFCGNPSPDGAAFCGNCGAKMDSAGTTPPSVAREIAAAAPEPVATPPAPEPAPAYTPPQPAFAPAYTAPAPQPKKSNRTLWIVVILLALFLCCCCVVAFALMSAVPQMTEFSREFNLILGTPTPARTR